MSGNTNLDLLLQSLNPELNAGDFVFCTVQDLANINVPDCVMVFREPEGFTLILRKETADLHRLPYSFISAWITLKVRSSLEAVGLTAAFSTALTKEKISCNVVAGYYHDHLFVPKQDAERAMKVLQTLSSQAKS